MEKRLRTVLAAAGVWCLSAGAASAAESGRAGGKFPCLADARRLCPDAGPALKARLACLRKLPAEKLSAACRHNLTAKDALEACGPDFVKFCKAHDRAVECLRGHGPELTPKCRAYAASVSFERRPGAGAPADSEP